MKHFRLISMFVILTCMILCNSCSGDYVNLGLPSRTQWKNQNEDGFYTYRDAKMFGSRVPDRDQWVELMSECTWEWAGTGYTITGPNGNSIFLPAMGYKSFSDSIEDIGTYGNYWTSTDEGVENSYYMFMYPDKMSIGFCSPYYQMPVRLARKVSVKKKLTLLCILVIAPTFPSLYILYALFL